MSLLTSSDSEDSSLPRRLTDNPEFTVIRRPRDFGYAPKNLVLYSEVRVGQELFGWLWADDSAHAANYLPLATKAPESTALGQYWIDHLRESNVSGLSPSEALKEAHSAGVSLMGGVVGPSSATTIPFEELTALAGELPPPKPASRGRHR